MALVAGERGVGSDQRKSILVLLDVFDGNLPAFHGVAFVAFGAHLPAMDIRVTLGTLVADIREDQLAVALRTAYGGMHAAKGIGSLVVVEVRNGADRLPAQTGVTSLAGDGQIAVGAFCSCPLLRLLVPKTKRRQQGKNQYKNVLHFAFAPLTNLWRIQNLKRRYLFGGPYTSTIRAYVPSIIRSRV